MQVECTYLFNPENTQASFIFSQAQIGIPKKATMMTKAILNWKAKTIEYLALAADHFVLTGYRSQGDIYQTWLDFTYSAWIHTWTGTKCTLMSWNWVQTFQFVFNAVQFDLPLKKSVQPLSWKYVGISSQLSFINTFTFCAPHIDWN